MEPSLGFKKIRIAISEHAGYLRFKVDGAYDFDDAYRGVKLLPEIMAEKNVPLALVDIRDVEGVMPDLDRHTLGILYAQTWGTGLKAAALERPEKINRLFENTAVNRLARTRIFSEEQPALKWLLSA